MDTKKKKTGNWVQLDCCLVFSVRVPMFFKQEASYPWILQRKTHSMYKSVL